jgi:bacteriocin-like protein
MNNKFQELNDEQLDQVNGGLLGLDQTLGTVTGLVSGLGLDPNVALGLGVNAQVTTPLGGVNLGTALGTEVGL